jgi:hypothetical protein
MDKTQNYLSAQKDLFQRSIATENRGKSYDVVFCLPSTLAKDTHAGFNNKILTKRSKIVAIEKIKSRRAWVKRQMQTMTKNFQIAGTDIHRLKVEKYIDTENEKIDYFPFDICGNFTAGLAGWFYRNQKHFADGIRIPMTLATILRGKQDLFPAIKEATKGKFAKIIDKIFKHTLFVHPFGITEAMMSNIKSQIFMIVQSMPDKIVDIKQINIYRNEDKSVKAMYMFVLDMYVYDRKVYNKPHRDIRKYNLLKKIINIYNKSVQNTNKVVLDKKIKKTKKIEVVVINNAYEIARFLNINSIKDLTAGKKAWITKIAKQNNINPIMATEKITRKVAK